MNIKIKVRDMASCIGGDYQETFRGVPIIVIRFKSNLHLYSFCYMGKRRTWRGFYPYTPRGGGWNQIKQTKKDFKTDQDLIDFVKTRTIEPIGVAE